MKETNPNGANQYQLDPRQKLCWENYINPKSKTFGNAYQSALKAGYEDATATQITTYDWFLEKRRRSNMFSKAEKVLDEMLDMPVEVNKFSGKGENEVLIMVTDPSLVKIKQDTAKFVAERLGKDDGYSTRSELTGKDGEPITDGLTDKQKKVLDALLYDQSKGTQQGNKRDES
jgi:hypothetical protein